MASQPPQPSHERASSPSPPQTRRPSIPHSTTSVEDSQTLFLHTPSPPSPTEPPSNLPSNPTTKHHSPNSTPANPDSEDPPKCWICFASPSEPTLPSPTTTQSSHWSHPCPCPLIAHESCLLDWVASQESSSPSSNTPIRCPQCQTEITISRPRSYIPEAVHAAQRVWDRALVPIVGMGAVAGVVGASWVGGLYSIYTIMGVDDATRLLGVDSGRGMSWGWKLSVPFVPVVLVLSRTTIADNIFPALPIFYFMSRVPTREARSLWPPSVAMVVASLPYLRGAYYELYKRVFTKRERAWEKEVKPKLGEDEEAEGRAQADNWGADRWGNAWGGMNFELGVELEIVEEQEVPNARAQPAAPGQNLPPAAQNFMQEHHAHIHNHVHDHHRPENNGVTISISQLASTITGALLFPSVAATIGHLLRFALPKSWTTPPSLWNRNARHGLLQSQFGRSVVGGCLFVVLKDSLRLYSKFRLARDQKKRRVVDYDAGKGKRRKGAAR